MAQQFLTASNPSPKVHSPRTRNPNANPGRSLEFARIALSSRWALCKSIGFNEKVLLQRIGEAILRGDLRLLQRALIDLSSYSGRWQEMAAALAGQLRSDGVEILPLQRMTRQFCAAENPIDIAVLSILLKSEQRLLVMASDERFGTHVLSREGDDVVLSNQDPRSLLRQIGCRLAVELDICSPISSEF